VPEIEFITPPIIKEILEQQKLILEMHDKILNSLSIPPAIFHTGGVPVDIKLKPTFEKNSIIKE